MVALETIAWFHLPEASYACFQPERILDRQIKDGEKNE
jgi:hypothetical protein